MKILFITLLLLSNLISKNFSVGTYNVENLFDLIDNKSEYDEYKPNSKENWNKKTYISKLENISKVINDANIDILALQEIENENVLKSLLSYIPQYKYYKLIKDKNSAIGLALISKYEIKDYRVIEVFGLGKHSRPILEVDVKIDNKILKIFVCHWLSKKSSEKYRLEYALSLMKRIKQLKNNEYVILGDLNSNYNEFQTFVSDKKLNDTYGITGINHLLKTIENNKFVSITQLKDSAQILHYNLWLELQNFQRFSSIFRNEKQTPDNIILGKNMFDNEGIEYIKNSFSVFKPNYLFKNNQVYRWQKSSNKFTGKGYSDHLLIYANFSTNKINNKSIKEKDSTNLEKSIDDLYKNPIIKNVKLKNVVLIYKDGRYNILKQQNARAILFYNKDENLGLKVGDKIDIEVNEVNNYKGQIEITSLNILNKTKSENFKDLFLDATKIDLFDEKYQNDIITNLKATYKKGYLYFDNTKIKLYSYDKTLLPKEGENIIVNSAHLTNYNLKKQLKIYKQNDYKVLKNAN